MTEFDSIIANLERQREAIDKALEALHEVSGTTHVAAKKTAAKKRRGRKRGGLTEEGRQRLSENMRKRWAAKRTGRQARKATKRKSG